MQWLLRCRLATDGNFALYVPIIAPNAWSPQELPLHSNWFALYLAQGLRYYLNSNRRTTGKHFVQLRPYADKDTHGILWFSIAGSVPHSVP